MTPERWNEVSGLFEAALEKDPRERRAFLAQACADDVALCAEVESLLIEHVRAGDFLKSPASAEAASALRVASDESLASEYDPYLGMTLGNRYHIEDRLASGGQALVYRARDMVVMSKPVVIKILHVAAGSNAWLRKKFNQEIEALARIDHPGIVGVLDTGELPGGPPFLVVQYVDGVTLRQLLASGPLDPVRAAAILRQIGAALEAAHSLGIAHRDLKPENIMLQRLGDGMELVKLIDFGIAKVDKSVSGKNTTKTMVAGTVPYMAPEQFQGENSSASDIYALGVIACEMLCGQPDIRALEGLPRLREHIHAALAYKPQDRPARAGEFGNVLAEQLCETRKEKSQPRVQILSQARLSWAVAMFLAVSLAAVALLYVSERSGTQAVELSLVPPEGTTFGAFAISPNGQQIAVIASDSAGNSSLWMRSLASLTFEPLEKTEGANHPFWSADSRTIGFFAGGKLKKVDASGGHVQTICMAEAGSTGGAWNAEGVILFTPNPATPLYRVSAAGGEPTPVTALDATRGESSHSWPQFLPDGRHFLFFAESAQPESAGVYVASTDSGGRTRILAAGSSVLYASGHLLFVREHTLMAQPFDPARLQLRGEAVALAEKVAVTGVSNRSLISASDGGVLAYGSSDAGSYTQLLWFDRAGKKLGAVTSGSGKQSYSNVNLSRNGTRLAVDRRDPETAERDVWLFDLARGGESRLTFDRASDASPVWSPDDSHVAFFSLRDGTWNLYVKLATGAGSTEPLLKSDRSKITCDWSRDRRYILFREWDPITKWDLWVLPMEGDRKPFRIVRTPLEEGCGQFSPDTRWLVYVSGESGREEVYVQPVALGSRETGRWQISNNGGTVPRWRGDGEELFYLGLDNKLMAMPVTSAATFHAGRSKPLFQTLAAGFLRYDVTADGERFLINTAIVEPPASLPTVVINWTERLKR